MPGLTGNRGKGARVAAGGANRIPKRLRRQAGKCEAKQDQRQSLRESSRPGGEIKADSQVIHEENKLRKFNRCARKKA
jgi:hypothetical protein